MLQRTDKTRGATLAERSGFTGPKLDGTPETLVYYWKVEGKQNLRCVLHSWIQYV